METLITLPYAPDALAPVLSAETISVHHGKHLAGYVNNLNAAIKDTSWEDLPLEQIMYESTLKSGNFEFDVTGLTGKNRNIPEKIKI